MLFNSLTFIVFLLLVFTLYWAISSRRLKLQNLLLIVASYVFYGFWDWRFLSLLFLSSLVDFTAGIQMSRLESGSRRRLFLGLSLLANLGALGIFKYFNFFSSSFTELLASFGLHASPVTINVILPVGISFYTFQTLSYSFDIYRGRLEATRDPFAFFAYVSFFPQLVAGPIERARNFLPQFLEPRRFELAAARDGMRQILWGFVKKVVIADNLAPHVESIFGNIEGQDGVTLLAGSLFFAIQIYGDFSGYTDIARGVARLFGFSIMRNFAFPYYSRDIAEFWRRWHISLSSWFRDYLYIPLGGGHRGQWRRSLNILFTFAVSGLWHGANWTFLAWGILNGLYYLPLALRRNARLETDDAVAAGRILPGLREMSKMTGTFLLVLLGWVFFRAKNIGEAGQYLARAASNPYDGLDYGDILFPTILCGFCLTWEWFFRHCDHGLDVESLPLPLRWSIYLLLGLAFPALGNFGSRAFIYFQF